MARLGFEEVLNDLMIWFVPFRMC